MTRNLLSAISATFLLAVPAEAHHSIGSTIDIEQNLEAEAVLTKVDWVNPHAWLHFDVTAADGTVVEGVMFETLGITGLRRAGIPNEDMFDVGQAYQITYYPNRSGRPGGYIVRMAPPEGEVLELRIRPLRRLPGRS